MRKGAWFGFGDRETRREGEMDQHRILPEARNSAEVRNILLHKKNLHQEWPFLTLMQKKHPGMCF